MTLAKKQFCIRRHAGRYRGCEVAFGDDGEWPGNRKDVPKIVARGARRDCDGDPARGHNSEVNRHQVGVIEHKQGDAIAGCHTGLAQRCREAANANRKIAVTYRLLAIHNRRLGWADDGQTTCQHILRSIHANAPQPWRRSAL
jgi:hypothetical protein